MESDIDRDNPIDLVSRQTNDVVEGGAGDGEFKGSVSDISMPDDVESGASSCVNWSSQTGPGTSVCSVLGEIRSIASSISRNGVGSVARLSNC